MKEYNSPCGYLKEVEIGAKLLSWQRNYSYHQEVEIGGYGCHNNVILDTILVVLRK